MHEKALLQVDDAAAEELQRIACKMEKLSAEGKGTLYNEPFESVKLETGLFLRLWLTGTVMAALAVVMVVFSERRRPL